MPEVMAQLFDDSSSCFMACRRGLGKGAVALFGVPYDGTTSFRPGSRFGPAAIRAVSAGLETYDPQLNRDLEAASLRDLGDLRIPFGAPEPVIELVQEGTATLLQAGMGPLMLGGEHSITTGAVAAVAAVHPNLALLQLDAHADLRHTWLGSRHSHACAMRRCLQVLPSGTLLQLGIRSGSRAEFQELRDSGRGIAADAGSLDRALAPLRGRPLYLTVDLDWFDPAVLPGTGTPEPGGFFWHDWARLVEELCHHNLVAADVVELSPQWDPSDCSSLLAAKVVRSLLLLLDRRW